MEHSAKRSHPFRVTLAAPGKFHALHLAREYAALDVLQGIYLVDRHLRPPAPIPFSRYHNRVDLAAWRLGHRILSLGFTESRKNQAFDAWMARAALKLPEGVIHGWNGAMSETFSALRGRGWLRCLERSCPHNLFQYDLLQDEGQRLGVPHREDKDALARAAGELDIADVIVVPSQYAFASYARYPHLRPKLRVNTLGANFPLSPRRERSGPLKVLMVGNDFLRKGTHYLIEAFKLIDDGAMELWIRGQVPSAYAKGLTNPRIKIFGDLLPNALKQLYAEASVFVQPSIDEGFGMTVLEALAYGLPVVVTENVGARDVLDEKVAVTVPIRDPEKMAKAILAAVRLPSTAFDLARARILEENTWRACAERMLTDVYVPGQSERSLSPNRS